VWREVLGYEDASARRVPSPECAGHGIHNDLAGSGQDSLGIFPHYRWISPVSSRQSSNFRLIEAVQLLLCPVTGGT